jgi:hypothetical protein
LLGMSGFLLIALPCVQLFAFVWDFVQLTASRQLV